MNQHKKRRFTRVILPILVLALGAFGASLLVVMKPETQKTDTGPEGAVVETRAVERQLHQLNVKVQGTVVPARRVQLQPQVSGEVLQVNDQLVPGGIIKAGEPLVRIDPADYKLAVSQRETQVQQARAQLKLEQGRQEVAEEELQLFSKQFDDPIRSPDLALREPQLASAKAQVESAEAALQQARLQLKRTTLSAPFDALVVSESVDKGQQVQPAQTLAELVAADQFWVRVFVPPEKLPFIAIPNTADESASSATIILDLGGTRHRYQGRVLRMEGALDPRSRLAQLLIAIDDPLALVRQNTNGGNAFPLLLDAYVDVHIAGERKIQAMAVPREAVHNGNEAYVYKDGKLSIRPLDIVWERDRDVLVQGGLQPGDKVITSNLAAPVEGMDLRLAEPVNPGDDVDSSEVAQAPGGTGQTGRSGTERTE